MILKLRCQSFISLQRNNGVPSRASRNKLTTNSQPPGGHQVRFPAHHRASGEQGIKKTATESRAYFEFPPGCERAWPCHMQTLSSTGFLHAPWPGGRKESSRSVYTIGQRLPNRLAFRPTDGLSSSREGPIHGAARQQRRQELHHRPPSSRNLRDARLETVAAHEAFRPSGPVNGWGSGARTATDRTGRP